MSFSLTGWKCKFNSGNTNLEIEAVEILMVVTEAVATQAALL